MSKDADKTKKRTFTFVTYNVGLLRLRLCGSGVVVFANPPHAAERLKHIPEALRRYPADVLALQECYEEAHAEYLCEELKDLYPHVARIDSQTTVRFHNGLLVLSRHPIVHARLQPYHRVAALERYLATKSNLIVDIRVHDDDDNDDDDDEVWRLVNMHTTAGGAVDPEHPGTDADRQDELKQAADAAVENPDASCGIILGDLNCGPEASPENFDYILRERHFRDTYAEAVEAGKLRHPTTNTTADHPTVTWDPKNYLNAIGPHKDCPGQRCDHVLLPAGDDKKNMADWQVERVEIILTEASVSLANRKQSTLSDHYGLLVQITKQ